MLGVRKIRKDPWTQEYKTTKIQERLSPKCNSRKRRQRISQWLLLPQKLWIPLHVPFPPPFIGRRKVFYIPKIPSNLGNIPCVNTYINVLYIPWFVGLNSYIYKPATSSHVKPGLLRLRLWLGFLLIPNYFIHGDLHILWLPNFAGFWMRNFTGSWAQSFAGSWFTQLHRFVCPKLCRFLIHATS
jgi:hypothetical protein